MIVFRELERASAQIGLEMKDVGVSEVSELKGAVKEAARARVAALVVIDGPVIANLQRQIVPLVAEAGLPIISQYADYAEDGGLMAYGPSLPEIYRRGAIYVDRILRGAKPSELPVEQPAVFELVVNLRTAKMLGLDVAPTLLARATRVIE
jgi:putative ABC transport system substrate-binding protein